MAQDKKKERSGYLVPGLLAGAGAGTLAATVPLGLAREQGTLPREYFPMVVEGLKRIDEATARNRGEGLGEFVIASGDALRNKVLGDHTGLDVIAAARRADLPIHQTIKSIPGMKLVWGDYWDPHLAALTETGTPFKIDDHYTSLVKGPVSGLRHIAGNETATAPAGYDAYTRSPLMQQRRDTALNAIIPGLQLLPENQQARVLNQMNQENLLPRPYTEYAETGPSARAAAAVDAVAGTVAGANISNTNQANRTLALSWLNALNAHLSGNDQVRNPGAQVNLDIEQGLRDAYTALNPGKPLPPDFANLPLEEQASLVRHFAKSPAGAETEHSLRGREYDYTKVLGAYTSPFRYLAQPMAYASEYWPWLAGAGALAAGAGGYGLYNAFRNNQEIDKEDDEEKKKTEETKAAMIKRADPPPPASAKPELLSSAFKGLGALLNKATAGDFKGWSGAFESEMKPYYDSVGDQTMSGAIDKFRNNNPWVDWAAGGLGVGAAAGLASGLIRRKRNKHRAIGDALTMGLLGGLTMGVGRHLGGEVLNMGGDVAKDVEKPKATIPPGTTAIPTGKTTSTTSAWSPPKLVRSDMAIDKTLEPLIPILATSGHSLEDIKNIPGVEKYLEGHTYRAPLTMSKVFAQRRDGIGDNLVDLKNNVNEYLALYNKAKTEALTTDERARAQILKQSFNEEVQRQQDHVTSWNVNTDPNATYAAQNNEAISPDNLRRMGYDLYKPYMDKAYHEDYLKVDPFGSPSLAERYVKPGTMYLDEGMQALAGVVGLPNMGDTGGQLIRGGLAGGVLSKGLQYNDRIWRDQAVKAAPYSAVVNWASKIDETALTTEFNKALAKLPDAKRIEVMNAIAAHADDPSIFSGKTVVNPDQTKALRTALSNIDKRTVTAVPANVSPDLVKKVMGLDANAGSLLAGGDAAVAKSVDAALTSKVPLADKVDDLAKAVAGIDQGLSTRLITAQTELNAADTAIGTLNKVKPTTAADVQRFTADMTVAQTARAQAVNDLNAAIADAERSHGVAIRGMRLAKLDHAGQQNLIIDLLKDPNTPADAKKRLQQMLNETVATRRLDPNAAATLVSGKETVAGRVLNPASIPAAAATTPAPGGLFTALSKGVKNPMVLGAVLNKLQYLAHNKALQQFGPRQSDNWGASRAEADSVEQILANARAARAAHPPQPK